MNWVAALAAWVGALFAYLNARRSGRALRLAEQQEDRRRPILVLYWQGGYLHRTQEDRFYMFLLSVSNPSDSNNAVARIDLRIEYRTGANFLATVNVPSVSQGDEMFAGDSRSNLEIPIKVDAHQTVVGRVFFRLKKALLKDCAVDSYVIVATDSHGGWTSVETALVQEIVDEAEIKKDRNPDKKSLGSTPSNDNK
jgi:hypothetical protein